MTQNQIFNLKCLFKHPGLLHQMLQAIKNLNLPVFRRHAGGLGQSRSCRRLGGSSWGWKCKLRASVEDSADRGAGASYRHAAHQTLPAGHHTWRSVSLWVEHLEHLNHSLLPPSLIRLLWRRPERHHRVLCLLPAWQQLLRLPLHHGKPLPVGTEDSVLICHHSNRRPW